MMETHINSRRNGGEGHEVRRDTFTGGVVQRTPEASKGTKPARSTLLGFIFYEKKCRTVGPLVRFFSAREFPYSGSGMQRACTLLCMFSPQTVNHVVFDRPFYNAARAANPRFDFDDRSGRPIKRLHGVLCSATRTRALLRF